MTMPTMYEYLNSLTTPDYTNLLGSPSISDFISNYTPSRFNSDVVRNSVTSPITQFLPTNALSSVGGYLKSLTSSNAPTLDQGSNLKDTNWSNMPFSSKLGFGIGALSSALDAISAHRAYKLGKSQLNFQKEQFNRQFEAQKGLTNSQLYDKQEWRNRNMPNQYMSPSEYLDK